MIGSPNFSRRGFLRSSCGAIASAALGTPLLAQEHHEPGAFHFAVVSDLHYRDERCGEYLLRVAAHLRALRPRPAFVVLAGDLSENGKPEELRAVRQIFHGLPMPVRVIVGNHDYLEGGGREPFEREFGPRVNYQFTHGGVQFLALDTTEHRRVYRIRIPDETFAWLDQTVPTLDPRRPTIVLTHFPLGRNWLRPVNTKPLLARLKDHRFVGALSGHWHGITERSEQGAHLSTGRCCSWWRENHDGSDEKGYTLCRASGGTLEHHFVAVAPASTARVS